MNAEQPHAFANAELERHAALFDSVERRPLTHEQRIAAVMMAPRSLVVAAAGSGKTSVMVAKVAHALAGGHCRPDDVLVLAFNNKAAGELDERLRARLDEQLGAGNTVAARTLHALGLDIITRVEGRRPRVLASDSGDAAREPDLLHQVLAHHVHHDTRFAEQWLLFRVFHHTDVRHPDEFSGHKQWRVFARRLEQRNGRRRGFLTLRGELVPTQFEQAIANWLFLHDVDYVYRGAGYWSRLAGWCRGHWGRPLRGRSGFFLGRQHIYICCLAGQAKDRFSRGLWRRPQRLMHRMQRVEVTLDEFRAGAAFDVLRKRLRLASTLAEGRMAVILDQLGHRLVPQQRAFLDRFVRAARLVGGDRPPLAACARGHADATRIQLHGPMLARLLAAYSEALKNSGSIDFEGMLHRAADYLDEQRYRHRYTLVLVDEFQDTSYGGIRLLKSLLAQQPACRLFAVGDDWQSVYRFAGAVPDVLSRFQHYFGDGAVTRLTTTFRFNQDIADLASHFIQQNPQQLRKAVHARLPGGHASLVLARYTSAAGMMAQCEACLDEIMASMAPMVREAGAGPAPGTGTDASGQQRRTSVTILGRYQHQRPAKLVEWQNRFTSLHIEFLTVHAAKGLEADVVIILGLQAGRYGFPGDIQDDPLMRLVMPPVEDFPHAEERRLFYVALTRARSRVYLVACARRPSPFVVEIRETVTASSAGEVRASTVFRELEPPLQVSPRPGAGAPARVS